MKGWVHCRRGRILREAAERERLEEQEREARAQRVAWRKRLALQHTISVSQPISDEPITITDENPEQLGLAVQEAMGKATTV